MREPSTAYRKLPYSLITIHNPNEEFSNVQL